MKSLSARGLHGWEQTWRRLKVTGEGLAVVIATIQFSGIKVYGYRTATDDFYPVKVTPNGEVVVSNV